jgi:hypothetical protein
VPFSITDLLFGIVVPALVAGTVLFLVTRFAALEVLKRSAAAVALAAGFLAGYGLLGLGPWKPQSHWHWLPYNLLLSLVALPLVGRVSGRWIIQGLLSLLVAGAAAWVLVPTWPDLAPPRTIQMVVWTVAVVAMTLLLEPLTRRVSGRLLPLVLTATLLAAAIVLALSGSLRFAQIAGLGMAALAGMTVAASRVGTAEPLSGAALSFSLLVSGLLLVGHVNSFSAVPTISYVLVPPAPLLLWMGVRFWPAPGIASPTWFRKWKRGLLLAGPSLVLLTLAVLLALLAELD